MSSFKSSLIKYFVGVALVMTALFVALFLHIPETNDPIYKVARMSNMFFVFALAGLGFYIGRQSAKEFTREKYENRPFDFESLEPWKLYKVLSMIKLKSYTLLLLVPAFIRKPEEIDFTEQVTYVRVWNEHLPKNIEQGSIICREKYDKICIHKENTQEN